MRYPTVLCLTLVLAACGKPPVARSDAQPVDSALVQFLLTSAAADFQAHGPPGPVQVREVRLGHVTAAGGEAVYRLCGQV